MTDEARFPFSVVPFSSSTFTLKGPVKFGACEKEVAESICAVANDAYALGLKCGRTEIDVVRLDHDLLNLWNERLKSLDAKIEALKAAGDKMENLLQRSVKKIRILLEQTEHNYGGGELAGHLTDDIKQALSGWQKARGE